MTSKKNEKCNPEYQTLINETVSSTQESMDAAQLLLKKRIEALSYGGYLLDDSNHKSNDEETNKRMNITNINDEDAHSRDESTALDDGNTINHNENESDGTSDDSNSEIKLSLTDRSRVISAPEDVEITQNNTSDKEDVDNIDEDADESDESLSTNVEDVEDEQDVEDVSDKITKKKKHFSIDLAGALIAVVLVIIVFIATILI